MPAPQWAWQAAKSLLIRLKSRVLVLSMERLKDGFLLRVHHSQQRLGGAFRFGFRSSLLPVLECPESASDNSDSRTAALTSIGIRMEMSPDPRPRRRNCEFAASVPSISYLAK